MDKKEKCKISCVIPCYNEEESLPYFYEELIQTVKNMKSGGEFGI